MKKLVVVVFFLMLLAFLALAQQPTSEPVKLELIAANLYLVTGGMGANGGLFVGDDGVLAVDAKMNRESYDQLMAELKKVTDKPVHFLVNTHSDYDHVLGNQFFPAGTLIIAQDNCRQEFFHVKRDGSPADFLKPELGPFIPAVTYRDKMDIWLGSKKVELWYFGVGHTTGDSVVYFPEAKTAFIGDQAFLGRPQLIHAYKGGNSFAHVQTLKKMLATLAAERFALGHDPLTDRAGIKKHIEWIEAMQEKIGQLVQQNKILEEIKKEFKDDESRLVEVVFNEIKKK